jgi:hypothetical protein
VVRINLNPGTTARDSAVPLATASGRLLAWMSAAYVCARAGVDPDLWGHVKFGLDTLQRGHVTVFDSYSFTQDAPWIDHEWLGEVVQALSYRAAGVTGLVLLKVGVLAAAFGLMGSAVRRAGEPSRWWLLAAGAAGMGPIAFSVRPQLWTILGVVIVCRALPDRRWLLWLPLVFMLWANLHGGWILGIAVGALSLVGRVIDTRSLKTVLRPAAFISVALAATLINPYGWRLWLLLVSTMGTARNIQEWRPIWEQKDASFAVLWAVIAAGVVATTAIRRRKQITWAAALPVGWLAVNSLFVTRLAPFFGEVAVLNLATAWQAPAEASTVVRRQRAWGFVMIDVLAVALVLLPNLISESRCLSIRQSWAPDLTAATAFESPLVRGRLVLPIDWGEYAIWHWGPRLRVSIDGRLGATRRSETVYSEETIRIQSAIRNGQPEGLPYLDRVRPEYVWLKLPAGAPTQVWLRANGYQIDVDTGQSFIGRRADLPPVAVGPPVSRCFP